MTAPVRLATLADFPVQPVTIQRTDTDGEIQEKLQSYYDREMPFFAATVETAAPGVFLVSGVSLMGNFQHTVMIDRQAWTVTIDNRTLD